MARKPGLGKGLNALIPDSEADSRQTSSSRSQGVISIPIEQITPNPHQPREKMDKNLLDELAASIREHGIIQPMIVAHKPDTDQFVLIAGERRWRAAKLAGLSMVPVIERTISEQAYLEIALIENLQRTDLTALEMAEAYRQLSEAFSLTHEQIAERVGKSRTSVSNTLRLLNLPGRVRETLAQGKISEGHARALLGLQSSQAQEAALETVLNLELNVRQTEALVQKMSGERPKKAAKAKLSPEISDLENHLRNYLGTKVKLNKGKKGGSLVIHYYSDEELDAILEKILPK